MEKSDDQGNEVDECLEKAEERIMNVADSREVFEKAKEVTVGMKSLNETLGQQKDRTLPPVEKLKISRAVREAGNIATKASNALTDDSNNYRSSEVTKLVDHIRDDANSVWEFMFPYEVPGNPILYGTFEAETVQKKGRISYASRQDSEDPEQPTDLECPKNKEEVKRQEEMLKFFNEICKKKHTALVSFFHAVLDPNSYSRSLENIYDCAVLIIKGKLFIHTRDTMPYIGTKKLKTKGKFEEESDHVIFSIDKKRWEELIIAFNITETFLKFGPPSD